MRHILVRRGGEGRKVEVLKRVSAESILGLCDKDCKEGRYTDRYRGLWVQDGSQEVFCQG